MNKIEKSLSLMRKSLQDFESEGIKIEDSTMEKVESYIRSGKTAEEIAAIFIREYSNEL